MWYKLKHNLSINFWVTVRDVTEHLVCKMAGTHHNSENRCCQLPLSTEHWESEKWGHLPAIMWSIQVTANAMLLLSAPNFSVVTTPEEQRPIQTYPNKWESQNKYADSIKNTRSHVRLKMTNHCHILNPFELIINYRPRDGPACGLPEFPNL